MVATSESRTISVAGVEDLSAIEPAWWRLLQDQQRLDRRGSITELRSHKNAERVRRFLEGRVRQGRMMIARVDGELVGICTYSPDGFLLEAPVRIWEIADVWVEPHARRQGIASALVERAEHECRMRGATEVRLTVYAMNEAALGLYAALGYAVTSYSLGRSMDE